MPDREKIITDLTMLREHYAFYESELRTIDDAIALLKGQKSKTGHWIVLDYCANEGIYCSECTNKIFDHITKPKKKLSQYCPHCGSRNEQFFKDGMVVFR